MKRKNLKPMIISALLAIGFGATSVGTSFALFTDKTETSISVTSGKVDVKNELTLVSYASSVDGTNENLAGKNAYTNLNVGSSFELDDNGNVVINKMVPGDKLTVKLTSKNKSNVKTKTRYVLSHATTTGKKDLMPALTITFDAGNEMEAVDLFKWTAHDAASSSTGDALYSLTATIEFVNHDDGIVANTEGRDNQYQDAACSIGLSLESVQANAATSLIDDINNYLSAQEVMEGKNATMHDAMEDVDELNGEVTPKVYTLDLVKTNYVWGVNEDQFVAKAANNANYNYFAVYEAMPATNEQTYSVYAAPSWSTTVVNTVVGFDAGDAENISQVSYVRNGANVEAQNVVIRTNSHNTVLTIDADKDTVNHYGKASKVEITAVDNNNCYNEHGDVAGNINLEKGKVVVHNDCSAGAVVIDMTAAELAKVTTLSADNSANKEVPIILNTSEVLWAANPNNGLINPTTNNIIYSSTGGTLPEGFDTMTKEQKEAAIASASDGLIQGVAAIKNTGYPTLQAAINAAQDGDTVVLLKNIEMASNEYLMVKKAITLNMNEKTITGKGGSNSLVYVTSNANLTIRGNGTIEDEQPSLFNVSANSVLTIYDGNYSADSDVMYINGSLVNVYGGSFTASTTTHKTWEIVYLKNAALANIYGGNFVTNEGGCYGFVLYDASEVNLGKLGEEGPTINSWRSCISSNGSASHKVTVNIYSGTYKANRNDAKIDDQNVIQLANTTAETQTLNIYGGTFEQTSHLESSCIVTLRYSGIINLNITGGTFNYGNNSKLFCGFGKDGSGYPSASNITVNAENNIIPKNVTIEVYGSGTVRIPERDFVVNQ